MSDLMIDLLADLHNVKCTATAPQMGDYNTPGFEEIGTGLPMLLVPLDAKLRAAMASGYMEGQSPTHSAQAAQDETALQVGYTLTETHTRNEDGTWAAVGAGEGSEYLILGKRPVAGAPAQWQQVMIDLMQTSPVV